MILDVESRRNLNWRAIDAAKEVDQKMLEKRIVKPKQLILLAKHFIMQTEESLNIEVMAPICDN
jgi:hypothetical protein